MRAQRGKPVEGVANDDLARGDQTEGRLPACPYRSVEEALNCFLFGRLPLIAWNGLRLLDVLMPALGDVRQTREEQRLLESAVFALKDFALSGFSRASIARRS